MDINTVSLLCVLVAFAVGVLIGRSLANAEHRADVESLRRMVEEVKHRGE